MLILRGQLPCWVTSQITVTADCTDLDIQLFCDFRCSITLSQNGSFKNDGSTMDFFCTIRFPCGMNDFRVKCCNIFAIYNTYGLLGLTVITWSVASP